MIIEAGLDPLILAIFSVTVVMLGMFSLFVLTVIRMRKILGNHKDVMKKLEEMEKRQ
jgi:hypothetical protein